jgi:hypothetical protein
VIDILTAADWQMTFGERAAIVGFLSELKPRLAIELGTAEGGALARIAEHSVEVHSFDLVAPNPEVAALANVTVHTGSSHVLLPRFLRELEARGADVDFVLVDGDHTAAGVERDVRDLLASPAVRRTLILVHDTLNDEVRAGLRRSEFAANPKVAHVELDFVGGHLSDGGPFDKELWGGLGLIVVGDGSDPTAQIAEGLRFHDLFELMSSARDALVAERGGAPAPPAAALLRRAKRSRAATRLRAARHALRRRASRSPRSG